MTKQEYWQGVKDVAEWIAEECEENGTDQEEALHDAIDSHENVIYYAKAAEVMIYTDNANAMQEVAALDTDTADWWKITTQFAFYAMSADVRGEMGNG